MSIYFLETEPADAEFFAQALAGQEVHFVTDLADVGPEARVVSPFIRPAIDAEFIGSHPKLGLIATRSSGLDHIDMAACEARGIEVRRVSSYGENTVAEHTFALILSLSRRLREVSAPPDGRRRFSYEQIRSFDLRGKTLGIIGAGRIGLHVIRIARAFGMEALAFDPAAENFYSDLLDFKYAPLNELLARAHIVSLHAPLRPDTQHILNRATLARCRLGALVINTARGGLIDTAALLEALDSGQIGGAGIDVLEDESVLRQEASKIISTQIINRLRAVHAPSELHDPDPARVRELEGLMRNKALLSRPNVVFTPHTAFNSVEAVERINSVTVGHIRAFLQNPPPSSP